MIDNFSELLQFSAYGGELILEDVKGTSGGGLVLENAVKTTDGIDRDMYAYVPKTGCPHDKLTQVFMVLRNCACRESAEETMHTYKLDELAEKYHIILLFPNPAEGGWNYREESGRENDIQYLQRCFAALPKSKGGVIGFNGMINYLGVDAESSAMLMTMAAQSPLDTSAVMVGNFPEDYTIPAGRNAQQAGWVYEGNSTAWNYLNAVNAQEYFGKENIISGYTEEALSAALIDDVYDRMFSETRRWRNDTYGLYQPRIDFEAEGFVKHVDDDSLGDNNSFKHTWYEYIPEKLRNTEEKAPLLFYLHGLDCTALYGAEQSGWSRIADREGFIVVYPNPSIEERWNIWDDSRIPSDVEYIMALIDHMKEVHPIDESRIYISGFSMGSMFTNALACAYPDIFAGAVAMNGPNWGYHQTLEDSRRSMVMMHPQSILKDIADTEETVSMIRSVSDAKKAAYDFRIPFVQFVGQQDFIGLNGCRFPVKKREDGSWTETIEDWVRFSGRKDYVLGFSEETPTGYASDTCERIGERFIEQTWKNDAGETLYHFITVERMGHAVDWRNTEIGWNIIKAYRRNRDGSLRRI
ncbi:MAG: alpha/beta hydrolase [Solobacterium sp.]|nr:alpha/beta hydrolase [Solobacterium sp.]